MSLLTNGSALLFAICPTHLKKESILDDCRRMNNEELRNFYYFLYHLNSNRKLMYFGMASISTYLGNCLKPFARAERHNPSASSWSILLKYSAIVSYVAGISFVVMALSDLKPRQALLDKTIEEIRDELSSRPVR